MISLTYTSRMSQRKTKPQTTEKLGFSNPKTEFFKQIANFALCQLNLRASFMRARFILCPRADA